MPRDPTAIRKYVFDAGPLGYLEGSTVLNVHSKEPILHYFGGLPYAAITPALSRFCRAKPLPDDHIFGTKFEPGHFSNNTAVCPQPLFKGPPDRALWDENCLQLNIYIPAGQESVAGWPVLFNIHGGFLQFGNANTPPASFAPILSETDFKAIIVQPAYRVNAFGFLSSHELQSEAQSKGESAGNTGLWDQRLALEWTSKNIRNFGGDPHNITICGYSAGSHSVFYQLAYELCFVPEEKAIIRRAIMWSNSPSVQPKSVHEQQEQFDELLKMLDIDENLSGSQKLARLRDVPVERLVAVQDMMKLSEFRVTSDGSFVSKSLFDKIKSGEFAQLMKAHRIKLLNGECRDEHAFYQRWRTPKNSFDAVFERLCADYPIEAVRAVCEYYNVNAGNIPPQFRDWQDCYGHIYANMQVHCSERGLHNALAKGGLEAGKDLLRYRIEWRATNVDDWLPSNWKVTHLTDYAIWFWGLDYGDGLTKEEKDILKPWNDAFASFVKGDCVSWGTKSVKEMKRLNSRGVIDIWVDDRWDEGTGLWRLLNG